jgi:dihydropteroate synthase
MPPLDADNPFLVTFRTSPGPAPEPACHLRIQVPDGQDAEHIEAFLAGATAERLRLQSRTTPSGVCFELGGTFHAFQRFLGEPAGGVHGAIRTANTLRDVIRRAAMEAIENWSRGGFELELPRGRTWKLRNGPAVLGILNVTPDSFSDGGLHDRPDRAVQRAREFLEAGADALDIGGESTRPGAAPVPEEEELRRVLPVVAAIRKLTECPISVDTSKATVARAALEEGADIINDVSALEGDPGMLPLLADRPVPVVLMHMQGQPRTMQENPSYVDVTAEILDYLWRRLAKVAAAGIAPGRAIVDPGIGFGKRSAHNLTLLAQINELRSLGRPILLGVSRKSFLGDLLGRSVEDREAGTLVANTFASLNGVHIVRVHHAGNAREMKKLLGALRDSSEGRSHA